MLNTPLSFCHEIIPRLWLGSLRSFTDELPILTTARDVGTVIRCLPEGSGSDLDSLQLVDAKALAARWKCRLHVVSIDDDPSADIYPHFAECCEIISHSLDTEGKAVLVHCQMGISRSASIVVAYMMWKKRPEITLDHALTYAMARREEVSPNVGFVQALVKWEEKLRGETTCEFDVRLYAMFRYLLAGVSNKEMRILYGQMSLKIMDEYERDDAFIVTMRADCKRAGYERPFQTY